MFLQKMPLREFYLVALTCLFLSFIPSAFALSEGQNSDPRTYIYGTVHTIDNRQISGVIRWGKEESFWTDMFNAEKTKHEFLSLVKASDLEPFLERKDPESLKNFEYKVKDMGFFDLWAVRSAEDMPLNLPRHYFSCFFGEISEMHMDVRDHVTIRLRNGEELLLKDNSNDVNTTLYVYDESGEEHKISWEKIVKVSFSEAPKNFPGLPGHPIYAKVKTVKGEFEGYIQWDHDECMSTDFLDGYSSNGANLSLAFGDIQALTRIESGFTMCELMNGKKVKLHGSNDVNASNRGLVVKHTDYGRVLINWMSFLSLQFDEPKESAPRYRDFETGIIEAEVITSEGESHTGRLIYDMDEQWTAEILNGKDAGFDYGIPFGKVLSLEPKNYGFTEVVLKSGKKLLLGGSQDVTDVMPGVMVLTEDSNIFIPREKISKIKVKN